MTSKPRKDQPAKPEAETKPAPSDADNADDGSAAAAAIAEVDADAGPLIVEFRGEQFEIDRANRASARYAIALAAGHNHIAIVELLGQAAVGQFIALCNRGEDFHDVSTEFFDALGKASGQGNS